MIVFGYGGGVNGYAAAFAAGCVYRMSDCPLCQTVGSLVGHGVYWRKPRDGERVYRIPIQRWLCKGCGHTVSALPDFLLGRRWYLLEVISQVLVQRAEAGASWSELEAEANGAPVVRTIQRWWQSFGEQGLRWLGRMQRVLAEQDSGSVWLDPQGEACQAGSTIQALLKAAGHLLAWGKSHWGELVEHGWKERLRFLWLWGSAQGLGRLV